MSSLGNNRIAVGAIGFNRRHFGLAVLGGLVTAACSKTAPNTAADAHDSGHAPHHWGYEGTDGADHWADLDADYAVCRTGRAQSPIDLPGHPQQINGSDITIDYAKPLASVEVVNNGHTLQANAAAGNGNRIVVAGTAYDLAQFHFHLPSEHTVDGKGTSMELHLVHKNPQGKLAVLGVLLQEKAGDSVFRSVLMGGPDKTDAKQTVNGPLDLRAYLPKDLGQYQYQGSLTTPPCTEGVAWTVLRTPVSVATDEAARFRTLFSKDSRPTQPANGRALAATDR